MDPNTARAEAERWLGIAAKLLTGRDFVGSRTFAIRAREADASNPIADQILAVVDTLIASEKRVISSTNYDWYSILGLSHLVRDPEVIASQYRRLVLLLNPDRNCLPYADFALRLVVDAWSVLSDPSRKWMYDSELSLFLQRNAAPAASDSFRVDPHPEPVRVDSAATFQFFQQPLQSQTQTQTQTQARSELQPQPQQWLYHHQPQQPQLEERQLFQQHQNPQPQTQTQSQPLTQLPAQAQPLQQQPAPVPREQQIPPQPQKEQQPESQPVQQKQQQRQAASTQRPQQQLGERGRGKEVNGRASDMDDERGTRNVSKDDSNVSASNKNKSNKSNDVGGDGDDNDGEIESFWTACPYCYYMYEYLKIFQDCTLRCQNCRRGFHALQIPNPPPVTGHGKETSFCCWGFFPLGFSMTSWKKNNSFGGNDTGFGNSWVPFSPIFACPGQGVKKNVVRKPVIYLDDDDDDEDFDISSSGEDSDSSGDWGNTRKNKKRKGVKGGRGRVGRKSNAEKERVKLKNQNLDGAAGGAAWNNPQGSAEMQGNLPHGVAGAKNDVTSKAGGSSGSRKQVGKGVRGRKKLDLNVEFSNEVEEHAPTAGNGEEEVEFFEGLDEFLSTLPILHVVGDDKAKPS